MAEKALTAVIQEACIHGVSTRSVDDPVKALGMTGVSKSPADRVRGDRRAGRRVPQPPDRGVDPRDFASPERLPGRPADGRRGRRPRLWIDATCVKVRRNGRIVSVAVIIAAGVDTEGRREVLGMDIGPAEAEPFRTEFLRKLARRGPRGVKLVFPDAQEGPEAAITRVPCATWQRRRGHFMRNALAHAGRSARRVVSAFMATAFPRNDAGAARQQWRRVADQLRTGLPKPAALLARMGFPARHQARLQSTNPPERLNGEVKRGTEGVGIFPDEASSRRPAGAILLGRTIQRARYTTLESIASVSDDAIASLTPVGP